MRRIVIATLFTAIALSGCTNSKTSPERHTYYFVSHRTNFVGGNFATNTHENYRLNLPQFKEVYERGKSDRTSGLSENEAKAYAQSIRDQLTKGVTTNHSFSGNASDKWTSEMEMKDAVLFGNELAASYLDGYNGVQ